MHATKIAAGLIGLGVTSAAMTTVNTQPATIMARDITTHGNFTAWCGNITPYGKSTSTIQAWCGHGGTGAPLQYISHIDLNQCLQNSNGHIAGATSGNAMQTCELGPSGRNACPKCDDAWFTFNCKARAGGPNTTSLVNLDNYIGLEQTTSAGHVVWVISCSTTTLNLGQFEGCSKEGATDPSC